MLRYAFVRLLYVVPVALGVSLVCFALVHLSPGGPLSAVLPPDASAELQAQLTKLYGFDRPYPVQFGRWLLLALLAAAIGFVVGLLCGFLAGYFRDTSIDRAVTTFAITGVSMPHYWLGMVLVIIFSVVLNWLPEEGIGPGGWAWDWEHIKYLILPAVTMSVIPMGLVTRTVRALVGDLLSQEFVIALRAKGLSKARIFAHVAKNAAPTILAVLGLQLGYLFGGSILIETVFSWPGTGFLLNSAIFQRDLPLLQGTILVLALFFVFLNLVVDVIQASIDPRIKRA